MRWRCDQRRKGEEEKECTPPLFFHLARAKPYSASWEGEGEGLGGEPEVRGGSGVEGARPQHPGIVFFFFFFFVLPNRPRQVPTGSGSEECVCKNPGCHLATRGGQVIQPADSRRGGPCGCGCCSHDSPAQTRTELSSSECRAKTELKSFPRAWHRPS